MVLEFKSGILYTQNQLKLKTQIFGYFMWDGRGLGRRRGRRGMSP